MNKWIMWSAIALLCAELYAAIRFQLKHGAPAVLPLWHSGTYPPAGAAALLRTLPAERRLPRRPSGGADAGPLTLEDLVAAEELGRASAAQGAAGDHGDQEPQQESSGARDVADKLARRLREILQDQLKSDAWPNKAQACSCLERLDRYLRDLRVSVP